MALFAAAARRAATSSLLQLRASVSPGGIALPRALAGAAARPTPFSSATGVRPSSGDDLRRVIKSGTNLSEQCDDHHPDDKNSVSSSDESSPSADESSSSSFRNQEDEGENRPKGHGRRLTYVYEMGDDSSVKFSCIAYPAEHKIVIKALALRPPPPFDQKLDEEVESTESEEVHFSESEEVVEFSMLDVKLQLALYKLVKPLGYGTPRITEVLQEPTMSKDQPRLLFWETELWDFLNKDVMTGKGPSISPFKMTDKGLEQMSKDEYLRVVNARIKYAVECNNCNRGERKITGDDIYRYFKMRGVTSFSPKVLQETILDKL